MAPAKGMTARAAVRVFRSKLVVTMMMTVIGKSNVSLDSVLMEGRESGHLSG